MHGEDVPGSGNQQSEANSWKSIAWFVEMHASPCVANRVPLRKEEFCEKGSGVRSEKRVEDVRVSLRAKVASRCRRSASPRTGCACGCRNRLATHARLPRCLHESSCRLLWMLRKRQGTPTKVGLLVAAGVHDDNNKRCSLPSGSNIILSLSLFFSLLSTAALRLSSWFAHSSSPFLRLFFSCSHLASARARARPAVPLISRFVCAFKHGFPSSGVSREERSSRRIREKPRITERETSR